MVMLLSIVVSDLLICFINYFLAIESNLKTVLPIGSIGRKEKKIFLLAA
jgi:hypothetical protein